MEKQNSILIRSAGIGAFILAIGFIVISFFEKHLIAFSPKYGDNIQIALMLLGLWLVVSATIRASNRISRSIDGWKLVLTGTIIPVFASWLFFLFRWLYPKITHTEKGMMDITLGWTLFAAVLGFIIAVVVLINIRIKSKFWGNVLEFLLYIALAVLFFVFMK